MPKTLGQLVTDTRDRLDEVTAQQWTEPQLRKWINEGARDLARRCEVLQDRADVNAVANTQEYALPAGVIRVYRVEYRPNGSTEVLPLEYRDFNNMDAVWWSQQTVARNKPRMFTMWGFPPNLKMIVYPTPDTAGSFKVFYYRFPADLATDGSADGTTVEVPEGWWDALVDYCEYMGLRKDADPRWQDAKAKYEETIGNLFDTSRRWSDQASVIVPDGPGPLPLWLIDEGYG